MKVTFHHSLQRGMKKNHLGWWHAERASPTPDFNRFPSLVHQSQLSWACLEALMQSDESSNYFSFHNKCQRSSLLPTLQLQEFQISANHYECVSNRFRCQVNLYCICSCWSQRWSSFKAERGRMERRERRSWMSDMPPLKKFCGMISWVFCLDGEDKALSSSTLCYIVR